MISCATAEAAEAASTRAADEAARFLIDSVIDIRFLRWAGADVGAVVADMAAAAAVWVGRGLTKRAILVSGSVRFRAAPRAGSPQIRAATLLMRQ